MFQLGKTIVSDDIIKKEFVCNLVACKGTCCIDGEAGAPLHKEETNILEEIYPKIAPLLRKEGIQAIEEQGTWIMSDCNELETPLINNADCAYVILDDKGIALCAIEKAYNQGIIHWKKPISCHLYPIRIQDYSDFSAITYHQWDICDEACNLGKELQIPIYKFVKDALIRRFGEHWYRELEKIAQNLT